MLIRRNPLPGNESIGTGIESAGIKRKRWFSNRKQRYYSMLLRKLALEYTHINLINILPVNE